MNKISIIKILFELKLRNYYKNIARIFHIYLNNKIYFAFKLLKVVLVWASLNLFYNLYYKNEYANYIIVFYTVMLIVLNIGMTATMKKSVLRPHNIELYQMSAINTKHIGLIFFVSEYIWKKFKEADLIIPLFFMAVKIGGIEVIAYTVCIESILLLILIFKIYIHNNIRQEKTDNISLLNFATYAFICGIIIKVTSVIANEIFKISKILRGYLYSFEAFEEDTIEVISGMLSVYFRDGISNIKKVLNIDILNVIDWKISVPVTLAALIVSCYIVNYYSINYGNVTHELNKKVGKVKEMYLRIINKLSRGYKNYFLIEKDLKIILNKISLLNKNIFSTVLIPYDFYIIITFAYCLKNHTKNNYLVVVSVIFCMVSILFNQINTISTTFSQVFRFELDMKNADLYKISKFSIRDVLEAKIYLCRVMSFIPFVITVIISGVLLIGVGGGMLINLLFIVTMLGIAIAVYFFAPKIKLYIYNHLMDKEQDDDEEEQEEKIDDMTQRFCDFPKNLFILPLMYVLLINSVFCLAKGNQWQTVLFIYLGWLAVMFIAQNIFIWRMVKVKEKTDSQERRVLNRE